MKVVIVGGGPGGLYLAALLKRADERHEVVVLERNRPDDPFGFGVVFSDNTMSALDEGDPAVARTLATLGPSWDAIEVRLRGKAMRCGGIGFTAVGRASLLRTLQRDAREAGVDLRFETAVGVPADLPDHDLLVAADGVTSTVRSWHADAFGYHGRVGDAKFIWLGTTKPFDCLTFLFQTNAHGTFGVHAYPFEAGRSTFLVETDPDTWRAAGLDAFDPGEHRPGTSDQRSVDYLAEEFAAALDGHALLASNSKWMNFVTVHNARWVHGTTVLIGDAAHTAHFSVGSGTRMAMEDALALSQALDDPSELPRALRRYEQARRPAVARIQAAAEPSLRWWERFGSGMDWDIERFMLHFLTRTPRITRGSLERRDASFVRAIDRWWQRAVAGQPEQPTLVDAARHLALTTGPDGHIQDDRALAQAARLRAAGAASIAVELAPGTPPEAAGRDCWRQLLVSERIRAELGLPTVLVLPEAERDLAQTLVQSGRADAVIGRASELTLRRGSWALPFTA